MPDVDAHVVSLFLTDFFSLLDSPATPDALPVPGRRRPFVEPPPRYFASRAPGEPAERLFFSILNLFLRH